MKNRKTFTLNTIQILLYTITINQLYATIATAAILTRAYIYTEADMLLPVEHRARSTVRIYICAYIIQII